MLYDLLKSHNYRPAALQQTSLGHFEIMVSVHGVDTRFIIDTGAAKTVLDLGFAREQELETVETTTYASGLGIARMVLYLVKDTPLFIGEFPLYVPELYAVDLRHVKQSLMEKGIMNTPNGVIGADVLHHHKAIIDYGNQLLYLQKQPVLITDTE
jgi:hypothetical protein